jgi:hypothetical protein
MPSITQVQPQTIKAGSQSTTLKIIGTNFPAQAAILWNDAPLATTAVDSNTLSGTVTSSSIAAPATIQLKVQNTQTMQSSAAVPLVIAPADSTSPSPLTISLTPLPQGAVTAPYTGTLGVSGGTAPYTWSIASGQLPAGLSLAANTGIISGTPTASGSYSFVVSVVDSSSSAQSATATVTMSVAAAPAVPTPLTINSSSLPSGTSGSGYSSSLQASGGTAPYTWSFVSGNLPAGLSLNTSTGLISGTPTASGNFSFGVSVHDAASPAQTTTATVILSLVPAGSPLAISSTILPGGTSNQPYSATLNATGGTAPYTWSGNLPAWLSLNPSTGLISGTPTASGTTNLSFTVTDSSSPAQTKSVSNLSLVVAPPALTVSASLVSGTANIAYSSQMSATGGTSPYTWSIPTANGNALPAGLTLAATTGIISGTPTTSGTFSFTVAVTDNGNPAQTKLATTSMIVAAAAPPPGPGTTWYVRPDGGSRYSSNQPQGQCDGQADVAYSGTGTNQHCAFGDVRFLWTDGSYTTSPSVSMPAWGWVGSGGDTYLIRGGPWRVGQSGPNPGDSFGLHGDPFDAGAPPPLNGTPTQHTRILGENYSSCGSKSAMTQIYGGFGVAFVFNLSGAQYVDMGCIELTRHSQCIKYGSPAVPASCSTSFPVDDYAQNGLITNTGTHDLLLQDMWIHGFTSRGIIGPIGGTVTATRVDIAYNGAAGWDFDDGAATPSVNGLLVATNMTIEWNGCNQAYPGTGAVSCYSQSTGGYGDGIGTPAGTCISNTITNSIFRYNTQDGYDFLHNDTGNCPSSVTGSISYGNNGQQFKWGPANNPMVFTNNLAIGNCWRMSQPMTGQPSTYNANLSDFCRASDTIVPGFGKNGTLLMANNTIISYAPTIMDVECAAVGCPNSVFTFENNIVIGYDNPTTWNTGGQVGGPGVFYYGAPIGQTIRSNNIYYGIGHNFSCPTGYPNEYCTDPLLVNEPVWAGESSLDNFNFNLTPGSPAKGAGMSIPSVTTDYNGQVRTNPPSIGAYN